MYLKSFPFLLVKTTIFFYSITNANIAKGERKDKRKSYFRFDYAEPNLIFVFTNVVKGECKGKRKSYFRIGSAEPYPIFYKDNMNEHRNK